MCFCVSLIGLTQNYNISGQITDTSNGELLIGANIFSATLNQGSSSNNYGFYSLNLLMDIQN